MKRLLGCLKKKRIKIPQVYICGKTISSILIFNFVVICLVLTLMMVFQEESPDNVVPAMGGMNSTFESDHRVAMDSVYNHLHHQSEFYRAVLNEAVPLLYSKDKMTRGAFGTSTNILDHAVFCMTSVRITKPYTFIKTQIPMMTATDVEFDIVRHDSPQQVRKDMEKSSRDNGTSLWERLKNRAKQRELPKGKPLVGIYHTHNSECYVPTSVVTHSAGENGDVYKVGATLKEALEEKQIATVHSAEIHDYPDFMQAYAKSIYTAKDMLNKYPSLEILIDLHRDALSKQESTVKIEGKALAKVSIVVGTDHLGLEHPNWKKNHEFAQVIVAEMEQLYPGLSGGIIVGKGRYNQHLDEHALIFEVGAHENALEEAERTAQALADVIEAVLKEMPQ